MTSRSFVVSGEDAGSRIDRYLTHHQQQESRSAIQKWFDRNLVLVNGHSVKPAYKLHSGDSIEVHVPSSEKAPVELNSWDFPIDVLYQDKSILVINKPAHIVVHPGAGKSEYTIVQAALHHFPEIRNVGHPVRPGVVHRLDKETSGVLLLAKTQEAYLKLTALFKNRMIQKHYRAVVYGRMRSQHGRVEKALGRDPANRQKISIRARKGRPAITIYTVLKHLDFGELLDVEIMTGRTHQIRVHLASENHPIVGDSKYGGGNWNRISDVSLRNQLKQAGFFGLHAFSLEFDHPFTGKRIHVETPPSESWNALLTPMR